ncbi:MAG: choline/ethanolamine kinase family protein [Gammaproteobacteria bacterium]
MAARDGGGVRSGLPEQARRAVDAVTAELGLAAPEVVALAGGPANFVLRLRDARRDLVLRVAGPGAAALGASRASEHAMHAQASAAGLAPELVLSRPEQGLLVTRHAAGRMLSRGDFEDSAQLQRIGAWVARLHALPPPPGLPFIDFGARAAGYLATLKSRAPCPAVDELAGRLAERRGSLTPARAVSCHHDLHHRNFIDAGDRLLAIDWEYAGPGDRAADLASCIGYHGLGPALQEALLSGYGSGSPLLRARLMELGWIFRCLWYGWNAVAALEGMAQDPALQSRLAAELLA